MYNTHFKCIPSKSKYIPNICDDICGLILTSRFFVVVVDSFTKNPNEMDRETHRKTNMYIIEFLKDIQKRVYDILYSLYVVLLIALSIFPVKK